MSENPSEIIMDLLKELALIKESDAKYRGAAGSDLETIDFEQRQARRQEITDQIKVLGQT